jgi:hypothetical protein
MKLPHEQHYLEIADVKADIMDELAKDHHIILSTMTDNTVRSRLVDFVHRELSIGFFSWIGTRKIHDMMNNPQVALCVNNVQIEGKAGIYIECDNGCKPLLEVYQQQLPDLYEKFHALSGTCFVVVEPTMYILMKYEQASLFLYHLDVVRNKAYRKKLSDW